MSPKTIIALTAAALLLSNPASAVMFKLYGGIDDTAPKLTLNVSTPSGFTPTFSTLPGPVFGAGLDFPLDSDFSLEIDALYVTRRSSETVDAAGDNLTDTFRMAQLPLILRWHLPAVVSIGVGAYFGYYIGQISETRTSASGASSEVSFAYADASQKTSDLGVLGSIALDFPFSATSGFIVDARYSFGVANNSTTSAASLRFNDFMLLAGFRFGGVK